MRSVLREVGRDNQDPVYIIDENCVLPGLEGSQVKIQVKACGLSALSNKELNELHKKSPQLHYSVGYEVAGIVIETGQDVSRFSPGDRVTGLIAPNSTSSGCAEQCIVDQYDIIPLPEGVSFTDAAGCIGDGVKAFTALHYLGHVCSGDTVLILDGASSFGTLAIQLAQTWGAKVLTTASTDEEKIYIDGFKPPVAQIIDMGSHNNEFVSSVMEETGGLGVDCIIDSGVRMFTSEEDMNSMCDNYKYPVPTKHELISCLSVGGKWVTSQPDLQLDPPNSQLLHFKCATVGFLFEYVWTLAAAQHGRYQRILCVRVAFSDSCLYIDNIVDMFQMEKNHLVMVF